MNKPVSHKLRLSLLSMMIALVATFLLALSVSAHTAPSLASAGPLRGGDPHVRIIRAQKGFNFNPHNMQLSLQQKDAVEFENETNASQVILDSNNKAALTLAPRTRGEIHFSSTGSFVYHLQSNSQAKVTIVVS